VDGHITNIGRSVPLWLQANINFFTKLFYRFALPPSFLACFGFGRGGPLACFLPFCDVFCRRLSFFILGSTTLYGPLTPCGRLDLFDAVCFLDTTYVTSFLRFPLAFLYNLKQYKKYAFRKCNFIKHYPVQSVYRFKIQYFPLHN
jgi:hypothetical protein